MSATGRGAERDVLDRYYTPVPLARRLVGLLPLSGSVLEPHGGGGAFVRAVQAVDTVRQVHVLDVDPDAPALQMSGFSRCMSFLDYRGRMDWVIGNPPYGDAEAHIRHGLSLARHVVYLLRLAMLASSTRMPLWAAHPCRRVWVLAQRPSFTGSGTDSCAYGWFWWDRQHTGETALSVLDTREAVGEQVALWGAA